MLKYQRLLRVIRQHRVICYATSRDILPAKRSLPIKNMPDPLLRSYCCSKQVLFEMCSRNSRTTVTIQKLFGDVDQSHRLATKDPITYNLAPLHLIQPLFLSLSHPPACNPPPHAALVCSPAPGMMVGTQQRPSTPNRCNAQGIPNTLRVSIASCKECEYTEREEGRGV